MTTLFDLEFQFSKLLSVNISASTFLVISEGIMVPTLKHEFFPRNFLSKGKEFCTVLLECKQIFDDFLWGLF